MKKWIRLICFLMVLGMTGMPAAHGQIAIAEIIKAGIKKVIKAVDLKIQRLQNQTIWLQNAQKVLENTMSKLKLDEISDWVDKQKNLYKDYFDELYRVKTIISYYNRIKEVTEKQARLVEEYKRAWNRLQQDDHFTTEELDYMERVYSGILDESLKNLDQLFLVIHSFATQMSDAKRLEIINAAADKVDENYNALQQFNTENAMLSLQRAKDANDAAVIKAMYGIDK